MVARVPFLFTHKADDTKPACNVQLTHHLYGNAVNANYESLESFSMRWYTDRLLAQFSEYDNNASLLQLIILGILFALKPRSPSFQVCWVPAGWVSGMVLNTTKKKKSSARNFISDGTT